VSRKWKYSHPGVIVTIAARLLLQDILEGSVPYIANQIGKAGLWMDDKVRMFEIIEYILQSKK